MTTPVRPQSEPSGPGAQPAVHGADDTEAVGASSEGAPSGASFGKPTAPGEVGTLGPYRLVKELGRGGMGAVYAAVDTRLDRRLALKLMLPKFAANPSAKERFLREARTAANITHDNVVTVYEADERGGVPYIAMQFLEGYPLNEYLKNKGNPTIPQILRIAAEIAAGLAAAHKNGLVHRDIKPANLWLEAPNGRVKVLDFGLARPVDTDVELTKSGVVVGTPAYMSPEQARGEKVDHRTDLFSLGVLLYRLCTGRLPFPGPTPTAVLMALAAEEPPPVRGLNPEVPESLAALIHQLLSKNADARPQSAAEVGRRVRAIAEELEVPRAWPAEQSASQPQVIPSQVIYVPIAVTAVPERNPFADLDASASEVAPRDSVTALAPAPAPERKKPPGRSPWPLAGALAFAALVVTGAILIFRNQDGTRGNVDPLDGATAPVKDKGGKTTAKTDTGKNQPPIETSADRKAAEWVLAQGGGVRVNGQMGTQYNATADLPKDRFTLTYISLLGKKVSDADLAHLKELKSLTDLYLNDTPVTDAGLAHLKELKSLKVLGLSGTPVTDAGLAHLKELKTLTALGLNDTAVTDAGLAHLKELKTLTALGLNASKVTDAGLAHLTGLRSLTTLQLDRTQVTDAGLAHLKELKSLANLHLDGTQVTDAGLAHLKELKGLKILLLSGTPLTDAGLAHLRELKSLTHLAVQRTKVTAKGLEEFHAAVPGCKIEHDGGVIQAIDVDRRAAEWVIAQGGTVRVTGQGTDIKAAADLPKERFTLTSVSLPKTVTEADLVHLKELKSLTHLRLSSTAVTDAGLAHLRGLQSLTYLNLDGRAVTDAGLAHLRELKSLTYLGVGGKGITDAGLAHLTELKNLTTLTLDGTGVTDAGLAQLRELKSLTFLNLLSTEKVTDAGLAQLTELKSLTGLNLRGTKVTAKGLADFHAAMLGCGITHDGGIIQAIDVDRRAAEWVLSLGGVVRVNGTVRDIKAAADLPAERYVLTAIDLNGNPQVTDESLALLKDCTSLKAVTLANTKVTDAGMAHLNRLDRLASLSLHGTRVTDLGVANFKNCTGMQYLYLHTMPITDDGLAHFKDCKSLLQVFVSNTAITDASLAHLKERKQLQILDVRKTKVTAKGLEEFHAAVPGCKIEHDGGTIPPKK